MRTDPAAGPLHFTCDYQQCRWFERRMKLDADLPCTKSAHCLGLKMLRGEIPPPTPPPPRKPFWRQEAFLMSVALIMIAGFVGALLIHARSSARGTALKTPAPVLPVPPSPQNTPVADARFEVNTLLASAHRLLDLWRGRQMAEGAAEAKTLNGQKVTSVGRTQDQALDQVKSDYRQEQFFASAIRASDQKISAETTRYIDIVRHVAQFPDLTVRAAFNALRNSPTYDQRERLALGLAEQHVADYTEHGNLSIKQIDDVYRDNALR